MGYNNGAGLVENFTHTQRSWIWSLCPVPATDLRGENKHGDCSWAWLQVPNFHPVPRWHSTGTRHLHLGNGLPVLMHSHYFDHILKPFRVNVSGIHLQDVMQGLLFGYVDLYVAYSCDTLHSNAAGVCLHLSLEGKIREGGLQMFLESCLHVAQIDLLKCSAASVYVSPLLKSNGVMQHLTSLSEW